MVYFSGIKKVARTGGSLVITLPKEIIDKFNIKKGDYLKIRIEPTQDLGIRYDDD